MIYVTKKLEFSASHRLFNPEFTPEKNEEIFDKCNNPNGHGHNYEIEVTIAGNPDPETGYVIDLKYLKRVLTDELIKHVDHKHLNYDVDFLSGYIPSVENLIVLFWRQLENKIKNGKLYKLKLYETANSFAEYFGEEVKLNKFTSK